MRKIYLDSAPIIYLVEQSEPFRFEVESFLRDDDYLVVSELSRLECRVKPMRDGAQHLLRDFDEFFQHFVDEVIDLSHEVIEKATEIQVNYSYRIPDSLHLAAAVVANCEIFLTNDTRLRSFHDLNVLLLSELRG
ncbi:MAG: type II toxin-antitoxin system VapC family toxin [Fimbriimonadia bacterium]|nr:type II toxin-antitoxin system VapC family toxin [Fimbriimonadia bacterium]